MGFARCPTSVSGNHQRNPKARFWEIGAGRRSADAAKELQSNYRRQSAGYCLIDDHARHRLAVFLLFGRVDAVGALVDGQAVDPALYGEVLQLAVVVGIILLEDGDGAAVAGHIDSLQAGIELDYIGAASHRKRGADRLLLQIEDGHQVVFLAGEKGAAVFHVERHAVISLTGFDRIAGDHGVSGGIDSGENVLVLKIQVNEFAYGVELRHAGFALEAQSLDDLVIADIDHGLGLAALVGDVKLVEGRSVGAAVRLVFGGNFGGHLHLAQVDHADFVLMPVRGVDLVKIGDVLHAFHAGDVRDGLHQLVGLEIDHVEDAGAEMGGEQVAIVVVDGEVVKALAGRAGEIEGRDLPEGGAGRSSGSDRVLSPAEGGDERGCHQQRSGRQFQNAH